LKFGPDGTTKEINTGQLKESVEADIDNIRYEVLSVLSRDPLMIEIARSLMHTPQKITALAKLNEPYMNGFKESGLKKKRNRHWSEVQQARVHMMTACLLLGHYDDHLITKKRLQDETLDL